MAGRLTKVDYKEVLKPEEFEVFRLREWRGSVALHGPRRVGRLSTAGILKTFLQDVLDLTRVCRSNGEGRSPRRLDSRHQGLLAQQEVDTSASREGAGGDLSSRQRCRLLLHLQLHHEMGRPEIATQPF
jgi:hypothetical protein